MNRFLNLKYFQFYILCLIFSPQVEGQESFQAMDNTIPPSPTAGSLVKGVTTPVSYYTGIPSVEIPLWEMKGRKLNVPITLSYHASGIRIEDMAGWVGLGWSLNAGGVITRTVRGVPDDHARGFLTIGGNQIPKILNSPEEYGGWLPPGDDEDEQMLYLRNIGRDIRDGEPDIFRFNFNGRGGSFFFDVDGEIVLQSKSNLKTTFQKNVNGEIDSWEIVDESGIIYTFGTTLAVERTATVNDLGVNGEFHCSAWYLISIKSPNNEDSFWFEYQNYTKSVRSSLPQRKVSGNDPKWEDMFKYQTHFTEGKYLQRITWARGYIDFFVKSLFAYPGGEITGLSSISIHSQGSGVQIKSFKFNYSFFPAVGCSTQQDYLPPCRRLRLDKVSEIPGSGEQSKPPYLFFYNETPLPPRGSFSQDHWGYYNGAENNHLIPRVTVRNYNDYLELPPSIDNSGALSFESLTAINLNISDLSENMWEMSGANRDPDPEKMQAGILKKIVYPTGGATLFDYEPHDFGYYSTPDKKTRLHIEAKHEIGSYQQEENSYLQLNFAQEVKVIPLFYIIAGSEKDLPDGSGEPSDGSGVFIKGPIEIDSDGDTIFKFNFRMNKELASGWEVTKKVWLPKGRYKICSIADELGDLTRAIIEYKQHSELDTTYKIYSQEYSSEKTKAGEMYFLDDKSEYRSITLDFDSLDHPMVRISFLFRSKIHPNRISSVGLEQATSSIKITRIGGAGEVIYEKGYFDDDVIKWNPVRNEWNYNGEEKRLLGPGRYQLEFIPRIDSEFGYVEIDWKKSVKVKNSKMAGGLRIKQISQVDRVSDTIGITAYKYIVEDEGETGSSGVLMSWPVYHDTPEEVYYLGDQNLLNFNAPPVTIYSLGRSAAANTAGSHIGYSMVQVSKPGAGKTVYEFSSSRDYPDITSKDFPYPPVVSYDWKRGLLKEKRIYRENGTLRQIETNNYNHFSDTINRSYLPAIKVVQKDPDSDYAYLYEKFYMATGWNVLEKRKIVTYGLDGLNPVETSESFKYNPGHLQLINKSVLDSDSSLLSTQYSYPGDSGCDSGPEIDILIEKHIVNTPVLTETFRDSLKIAGEKIKYGIFHEGMILPTKIEKLEGNEYQDVMHFDSYDTKGNILQYHEEGDLYNSFNWDSDKLLLLAQAVNSEHRVNILDYPDDSYVTKYTHHPFWGPTSETNENSIITHYDYDNYGRLIKISNNENKILKTYGYHLKAYQGDTTRQGLEIIELTPSVPPDAIIATNASIVPSCGTELHVSSGILGTGAEWVWYQDFCGGSRLGDGPSVYLVPEQSTNYYVRAEGDANNTECASIYIEVSNPSLHPAPDIIYFDAQGTEQNSQQVELNYNGCDPLLISADVPWLSLNYTPGEDLRVACEVNESGERTGTIHLSGNGIEGSIPVQQSSSAPLNISLNYSPSFIQVGDMINFTANVENGSIPYHYVWERRESDSIHWSIIRDINESYSRTDSFSLKAGQTEFYVRCTVSSNNESVSQTILIKLAN